MLRVLCLVVVLINYKWTRLDAASLYISLSLYIYIFTFLRTLHLLCIVVNRSRSQCNPGPRSRFPPSFQPSKHHHPCPIVRFDTHKTPKIQLIGHQHGLCPDLAGPQMSNARMLNCSWKPRHCRRLLLQVPTTIYAQTIIAGLCLCFSPHCHPVFLASPDVACPQSHKIGEKGHRPRGDTALSSITSFETSVFLPREPQWAEETPMVCTRSHTHHRTRKPVDLIEGPNKVFKGRSTKGPQLRLHQ